MARLGMARLVVARRGSSRLGEARARLQTGDGLGRLLSLDAMTEEEIWRKLADEETDFIRAIYADMTLVYEPGADRHSGALLSAEMTDRIANHLGFGAFGTLGPTGENRSEP